MKDSSSRKPIFHPLDTQSPANASERKRRGKRQGEGEREALGHMPAEAKPREPAPPLTWAQSSPSSGVISVSLWTTTLVTDMSGCCSLASLIA